MIKNKIRLLVTFLPMMTSFVVADELCTQISKTAMLVMQARQDSEPMAAMMMVADAQPAERRDLVRDLVVAAYERDLRYSQEAKRLEINEFGSNVYRMCLRVPE